MCDFQLNHMLCLNFNNYEKEKFDSLTPKTNFTFDKIKCDPETIAAKTVWGSKILRTS